MSLSIELSAEPPRSWETLARERGFFYHQPAWVRSLARAYSYPLHCLTASRGEQVVGFLALAAVPALLGRRRLVSLPFSYAAGPLALDSESRQQLLASARELARNAAVGRLELKQRGGEEPAAGME